MNSHVKFMQKRENEEAIEAIKAEIKKEQQDKSQKMPMSG